jgi:HupE / UreJ protein
MNEWATFVQLGFRHIVDPSAADHILFLLALAAIYRPTDWRRVLAVVSAFTVGHSVTLALAVTGAVTLPSNVIEFLIPVTILITATENFFVRDGGRYRPVFAGVFGLVHGAGFANYLRALFVDHVAVPLFGFNVGIELGQIVVLGAIAIVLLGVDRLVPLRLRVAGISAVVAIVAAGWAVERRPW